MFVLRKIVPVFALAIASLCAATCAQAGSIPTEPNNSPNKSTILPGGQFIVSGDLNGNVGRPDTLLAEFDPAYKTKMVTDDNSSTSGNGKASELFNVPLRPNGSAYFAVTGGSDTGFTGAHSVSGRYSVSFNIFDKTGQFYKTETTQFDSVIPGMIDYVWLNPPAVADPKLVGATANVIVNNIVGPGTGDSMDFYTFSGLQPGQAFTAKITETTFHPLIGVFDNSGHLILTSDPNAPLGQVTGIANAQGKVVIGVSAMEDLLFKGEHAETGTYTLAIAQVPEPGSVVLLGVGGTLACCSLRLRRRAATRRV